MSQEVERSADGACVFRGYSHILKIEAPGVIRFCKNYVIHSLLEVLICKSGSRKKTNL